MISVLAHPRGVRTRPGLLQPRLVSRRGHRAHVALVAGGALLIGGDEISVEIAVEAGCTLRLEDIGGTVAYPSRGEASRFDVRIALGEGARLVWESHPFVVAEGADVRRRTEVVLGAGAALCLRETLVLGRTGEQGGRLRTLLQVHQEDGVPVLVEDLALDGLAPRPGILGDASVLDTVLVAGLRPGPAAGAGTDAGGGAGPGGGVGPGGRAGADAPAGVTVLELARPGALARSRGRATHDSAVAPVWAAWSQEVAA
ncbi:hypothetical protein GCM10009793_28280 [Brachybacterium phenoliresistens]